MAKRCLVLGSALCLPDDVKAALALSEFEGVVVAKGAGLWWGGPVDAWVTLHPDRIRKAIDDRRRLGYPDAPRVFGHKAGDGITDAVPYKFDCQVRSGSSGLFACKVAFDLGFEKIVICGCPLDRSQGRMDGLSHWNGASSFRQGWQEALPVLKQKARSMSGYTKALLGVPTSEWLEYQQPRDAA